ncbi:hypothetical protein ACFL29_00640 [Patescibacteria group bacterium]
MIIINLTKLILVLGGFGSAVGFSVYGFLADNPEHKPIACFIAIIGLIIGYLYRNEAIIKKDNTIPPVE